MAIIKWTPFRDLDKLFDEDMFPILPAMSRNARPAMDIYETKDNVVAEMQLGGVDPKDVQVMVENDVLTVKGEMKEEKEEEGKEKDYYFKEIRKGSFMRSATLPVHVKGDMAKAESMNGMLKITIPKMEKKDVKQIPIEVKK